MKPTDTHHARRRTPATCLVTGGAGFIGCAMSSALSERYERVIALDNLHRQVHVSGQRPEALDRRVELVVGDVTDPHVWNRLLDTVRPDVVVHLAAETGTGQSLTEATRHADVNVCGTTVMLDALARHAHVPKRFLLASSRAVYGEGAWADGTHARYPGQRTRAQLDAGRWAFDGLTPLAHSAASVEPRPTSIYGATKLAQDHILKAWALAFGSEVAILRLQNVYGPGQSLINAYTGICSLFTQWAREKRSIPVYEDGRIVRDFVFIDDVARAMTAALTIPHVASTPCDIGSGTATTVWELANLLAARYGAPSPHVNGKFRHGDVRHAACDITTAREELGWNPRVPLTEGLDRLCAWIEASLERAEVKHGIAVAV